MDILCLQRYQQFIILKKIWSNNTNTSKRTAVNVAYKLYGSKPLEGTKHVTVLHGLLGSKRNWDSISKKIATTTKASVIAADARNHGESPHNNSHTYLDLASDVVQLLTKMSISKTHIIGHSMGGRTGMVLALTEPTKVSSLVVVDISPIPTTIPEDKDNFFPRLIDVMKSIDFSGCDLSKARTVAKEKLLSSGLISNMEGMSFILMNIAQLPDKSYGWRCNLDALKEHFVDIATFPTEMSGKTYSGPTLFIGGGRSVFIPWHKVIASFWNVYDEKGVHIASTSNDWRNSKMMMASKQLGYEEDVIIVGHTAASFLPAIIVWLSIQVSMLGTGFFQRREIAPLYHVCGKVVKCFMSNFPYLAEILAPSMS